MKIDTILALEPGGLQANAWTSAVAGSFRSADGASNAEREANASTSEVRGYARGRGGMR